MGSLFSGKVLLVDVDSVVLTHASLSHWNQILHGILEIFILLDLLAVTFDVALLSCIHVLLEVEANEVLATVARPLTVATSIDTTYLWPSSFLMKHTSGLHHDTLSVYSSLGKMRSRVDSL